jgi:hypothetical protein
MVWMFQGVFPQYDVGAAGGTGFQTCRVAGIQAGNVQDSPGVLSGEPSSETESATAC